MSAIAGVLRFGGAPAAPHDVQRMTAVMAASGRDGISHWHLGPIALGHCLLRATPESAGETQPLQHQSAGLVLVMDGRIDNRAQLQRDLRGVRAPVGIESDAELVLRAYEAWGEDSPGHLLGDFAYAIWDAGRQTLFCAADHVGACPFFFAATDNFFAFASTEQALLAVPGIDSHPNADLIAYLMVPQLIPADPAGSWLEQVRRLLPGQTARVTVDGECDVSTYWRFEPGEELRFGSEQEAQSEFMSVFGEAVDARLRAVGPVAQMLSGGLDSAGIRGAVARHSPSILGSAYRTYSAVSDEAGSCIESRCIRSMANGVNASFLNVPSLTGMLGIGDLVREAWSHAHPCDNSIMLPAMMCLASRNAGDRVMLHGVTGDVSWNAPQRFPAYLMRQGRWRAAWAECKAASHHHNYLRATAPTKLFLLNTWTALAPGQLRTAVSRIGQAGTRSDLSMLNPDFARSQRVLERLELQKRHAAIGRSVWQSPQQSQVQALHGPTGIALGLGGFGRLGKRFGLEMRDPWADKRVVQFLLRLPLQFKTGRGWTKYLVRTSFDGTLEPEVRWRVGKEHLGWQMTLRLLAESRALIQDCLAKDMGDVARYIDVNHARARAHKYFENARQLDAQSDDDALFVYNVAVLVQWLKGLSKPVKVR